MNPTVRLHRKLYSKTAIDAAKAAFEHLADISVVRDTDWYKVEFVDPDPDVQEVIAHEFANFALAEVVESVKK
ncbi:MAG: hypothetical protein HUU55_07770 [Myxococcales bacterium]|nr:hypothetical protein [Myxococcales bacterium]